MLVENALFATLDPTTRRAAAEDGRVYTLSDTVGFVRHLPHQLVEAFRSTLEEVADADLVVHVVDGAHADPEGQVAAVREVLGEVGADRIPELLVINKIDVADRGDAAAAEADLAGRGVRVRPSGPASRSCARRSRTGCRGRRSTCGSCCRTTGATWWPGSTARPGARDAPHR